MELTRKEVLEIHQAVSQLKEIKVGNIKFLYNLTKNFRIISAEVESIQAGLNPPIEVASFERVRVEFINNLALKDKDGNIIWKTPGQEPLIAVTAESEETIQRFFSEHKDELKALEEFNRKAEEFLSEKVSLDLVKFKVDDLPEEHINFNLMNILYPLIEE